MSNEGEHYILAGAVEKLLKTDKYDNCMGITRFVNLAWHMIG